MKPRLPRKYKKKVKQIVTVNLAMKAVKCALVAVQSSVRLATLSSVPSFTSGGYVGHHVMAGKAIEAVSVVSDSAQAINKILSQKPNSWKDFLRTPEH